MTVVNIPYHHSIKVGDVVDTPDGEGKVTRLDRGGNKFEVTLFEETKPETEKPVKDLSGPDPEGIVARNQDEVGSTCSYCEEPEWPDKTGKPTCCTIAKQQWSRANR